MKTYSGLSKSKLALICNKKRLYYVGTYTCSQLYKILEINNFRIKEKYRREISNFLCFLFDYFINVNIFQNFVYSARITMGKFSASQCVTVYTDTWIHFDFFFFFYVFIIPT